MSNLDNVTGSSPRTTCWKWWVVGWFGAVSLTAGLSASHPPLGTDGVVNMFEDTPYEIRAEHFGFSDPVDVPPNEFRQIIVTALPSAGKLLYDGLPIVTGNPVHFIPDVPRRWSGRADTQPWKALAMSADGTNFLGLWSEMRPDGMVGGGTRNFETTGLWDVNMPPLSWTAIALSADGSRAIAAAKNSQLYISTEFRPYWSTHGPTAEWVSVAMSADGQRIVAVPAFGQVHVSSDGGTTWVTRLNQMQWSEVAISANGSLMVAAGSGLWVSVDSGVTWVQRLSTGGYRGLAVAADGSLIGVTQGQTFKLSPDLGLTWEKRGPDLDWGRIATSRDGSRWLAIASYRLHVSLDSGYTWTEREETLEWAAVAISADGQTLAAAPADGYIRHTTAAQLPLVFVPDPQASGDAYAQLSFRVGDDGAPGTNLAESTNQLTFNVQSVNDPPVAVRSLPEVTGSELTPLTVEIPANTFIDPDGPSELGLIYSASLASGKPLPGWLSFDPSTRTFTGTPRGGRHPETWEIRVTASDVGVPPASAIADFRIQLTNVEDVPAANDVSVTTKEDSILAFSPRDFGFHDPFDDPPNRLRNIQLLSLPETGQLTIDGAPATVGASVRITPTRAAPPWISGAGSRSWQDIAISADGRRLAAIEGTGHIHLSDDGGASWQERTLPTGWVGQGRGITMSADGQRLAVVSSDGFIHTSADGGSTWQVRGEKHYWRRIAGSADGSRLFALNISSELQVSEDFGATWESRGANGGLGIWVDLAASADGQRLAVASQQGPIYVSRDAGLTWTARATNRPWSSVCSSADGQVLAAVWPATLRRTSPRMGAKRGRHAASARGSILPAPGTANK